VIKIKLADPLIRHKPAERYIRSALASAGDTLYPFGMAAQTSVNPFWRDMQFGAVLVAAPVVWGVMAWMLPSGFQADEALSKPGHFLMLAGGYPVLEEIVFRGVLQGYLRRSSWGMHRMGPLTIANILSSFVFTSLHFLSHPPLAAMLVFAPSLVFGYFRDRTDEDRTHGMGAPVILHVWYNTGYFLIFGIG